MQRYALKLVLIGDSRVGKSQLSRTFDEAQVTVGIEFSTKVIEFEKSLIQTHIWDTAGQERLQGMTKAYFKNTAGAILVYDVCNRKSFENLQTVWLKQLREQGYTDVRLMLVGNKVDLLESGKEREVSISEATEFARQENMDFFETSALTSYCVEPMFRRISLSIARVLPEVLVHLEVSYLPDGWMACVDDSPETEEAVTSSSDISLSDVAAALNEGPALAPSLTLSLSASSSSSYSSSPSIGNKRLSLASSVERTKSPLAAAAQRLKYINYWTGEVTRERPTYPAALSEGILHVARDTASADIDPFSGKPVERGLKERTSSCKTTATYVSSTSAASGSGGRSSSNEQQPNYDLHESRRSSMSKSSAEGGSSVTRCLRASCVIS